MSERIKNKNFSATEKAELYQIICRLEAATDKLRRLQASKLSIHRINGICCQYCLLFETKDCPVREASNWSRWVNFCNCYIQNPAYLEAQSFSALLKDNL